MLRTLDESGPTGCPPQPNPLSQRAGRRGEACLALVGVHFLRKRKSSLLMAVAEDATIGQV